MSLNCFVFCTISLEILIFFYAIEFSENHQAASNQKTFFEKVATGSKLSNVRLLYMYRSSNRDFILLLYVISLYLQTINKLMLKNQTFFLLFNCLVTTLSLKYKKSEKIRCEKKMFCISYSENLITFFETANDACTYPNQQRLSIYKTL